METNEKKAYEHNGSPSGDLQQNYLSEVAVDDRVEVLIHQAGLPTSKILQDTRTGMKESNTTFSVTGELKIRQMPHSQVHDLDDAIIPLSDESSPSGKQLCMDTPVMESNTLGIRCSGGGLFNTSQISEGTSVGQISGLLVCFLFYTANLATDIAVCYFLFFSGKKLWFGLALAFTILPTLMLNVISYHLSVQKMLIKRSQWNHAESLIVSIIIAVFHVAQCGVLLRYFGFVLLEELEYLWMVFCPKKFLKDKAVCTGKNVELPYIPYMFLVEAIMQCFPQLILQLYILLQADHLDREIYYVLIASIVVTLLNLARLLTVCQYVVKQFTISIIGLVCIFFWHLFTSAARVLAFALFATRFLPVFISLCVCHWIIMSFWSIQLQTSFSNLCDWSLCHVNAKKYLKSLLYGIVYILCFMSVQIREDASESSLPTCYFYIFFYSVMFLENTVLVVLWYLYSQHNIIYPISMLFTVIFCFFIGISFMVIYYRFFHKNVVKHPRRWKFAMVYPTNKNDI